MSRITNPALMLVPEEALWSLLTLFIVLGGLCLVIGARKTAVGLIGTALTVPFVNVLVAALFEELFALVPAELANIVAWLIVGIAYLAVFGGLAASVRGEKRWNEDKRQFGGWLAGRLMRLAFSWPMLLIWAAIGFYIWLS